MVVDDCQQYHSTSKVAKCNLTVVYSCEYGGECSGQMVVGTSA